MKKLIALLSAHSGVSDYKINVHSKESLELFFVKGKLETVRRTENCDKQVTVYVDHDGYKGDAQFLIYPSTTPEQTEALLDEAVSKARLIQNPSYSLPAGETGQYQVQSNFSAFSMTELAQKIAEDVFAANTVENASLNSVEIFLNRHTDTVVNSRGLEKTQVRYDAMVEAIPTYNGPEQSVELYQQYNFSQYDSSAVKSEIRGKLLEVKSRYEAAAPAQPLTCPVVLGKHELSELYAEIARDLDYAGVYFHSNVFSKGDTIQKDPCGDLIGITMTGGLKGSVRSARFDGDGMTLGSHRIVEAGKAVSYYGSNRYGQYLGETPTGELRCLQADPGTATPADFPDTYLEVLSMSGLQVDFYTDYIGGEVRLALYHDAGKVIPVTGISISGKLGAVLSSIRLSQTCALQGSYFGPETAILTGMSIF